jgi:hypothetical protein
MWRLPSYELDPGDYIVLWLDNQPGQGFRHTTLTANPIGGFIGLFNGTDDIPYYIPAIDLLFYGEFEDERSWQRIPDGTQYWEFADPTPYNFNISAICEENLTTPDVLTLSAFPNPFNGSLTINIPQGMQNLSIFDIRGNKIDEIKGLNHTQSIVWTPKKDVPSGIYYVKCTDNFGLTTQGIKIVFLK